MGIFDQERDLVCSCEKYIAPCAGCGKEMLKKNMVTVLVKRRYSNPKIITHLCEECYSRLCDDYEIENK